MTHVTGGGYSFGSLDVGTYIVTYSNPWSHLEQTNLTHNVQTFVTVNLSSVEEATIHFGIRFHELHTVTYYGNGYSGGCLPTDGNG